MYAMADLVIGQSQETVDYVRNLFPGKRYFLYRNLDQPSPYRERGVAYDADNLRIVYAGLLGVAQGVLKICHDIDFAALGIRLDIYGAGNEAEGLRAYLAETPNSNINYHGSVPKTEIPAILAKAHATLVPLTDPIHGAFPSKVFMAASAGLPILFAGSGEGARVVERMGLGLVSPPGDSAALRQNLLRLRRMGPEAYQALRDSCIQASKGAFNLEQQLQDLDTELRALLPTTELKPTN